MALPRRKKGRRLGVALAAGGMLQKQAEKMGLGKIEVTSTTINSAAASIRWRIDS